jgi:ribonuclease HIII
VDFVAKSSSVYVVKVDVSIENQLRGGLLERGFVLTQPPYTLFAGKKKGVSCTLYQSGKLVVQGKDMGEFIEFYLEPEVLKVFEYGKVAAAVKAIEGQDMTPHIGVDEAGKGDFFGPLCIGGLLAGEGQVERLQELGVRDSKGLSDPVIVKLARAIRAEFAYEVVRIFPSKYNEMYSQFQNLNKLLAWGHARVIETLAERGECAYALVDQFAAEWVVENALKKRGVTLELRQRTKGESDLVVAGASILARAAFVDGIDRLSDEIGIPLPKGASSKVIEAGRKVLAAKGPEGLAHVSKRHFKTWNEVVR